ncbi:MAG: LPS-assembly protein LptD [Bacteroidetes bacterium]|nr:LPS-assembly protein LptD [Bacteroidota bacterium]
MLKKYLKLVFITAAWIYSGCLSFGQNNPVTPGNNMIQQDTVLVDTARTASQSGSGNVIEVPIKYNSEDSIRSEVKARKVYLYGQAVVNYEDIVLEADYIVLDIKSNVVMATGWPDSTGTIVGRPHFKDGPEEFDADTLEYNFKTQKGIIKGIVTEEQGGYLHSTRTKKHANGEIHVKSGKYTTCDAEHPHFYIALTKAKVIPDDKIVSGPAYLVVEDLPLPLILPFGFFPNQKGRASGVLIPDYGEEKNRGFFFRNGGYYFALSDYADLAIRGDIYTNGTYGLRLSSRYKKRYKFTGNLNARYYKNVSGEQGLPNYRSSSDYSITWSHSQDPKNNPGATFSGNVNMSSSSYDQNHSRTSNSYLTNTKTSSISYSRRWEGTPFNFSASMNHSQNSRNKTVSLNLPRANFNMSRIYPFKPKSLVGETKWYQNIELSYQAKMDNRINTTDEKFLTSDMFDEMKNGFQHSIPLSTVFRPFNNFSISPQVRYSGVLYSRSIERNWEDDQVVTDTIKGISYAHALVPSISFGLTPKIYGMFLPRNPDSKIIAVRHVMSPSISMSLVPDMSEITPSYYREYQTDTTGRTRKYSIYESEIYSTPSLPGRSGSISFSLNNNIEMKLRNLEDTTKDARKVKIIDRFNFSTNYNMFADSLNLAPVIFRGSTKLFKKVSLSFGGAFDPYAINENGTRINTFEIKQTGKLFRVTRLNMSVNASFSSKAGGGGGSSTPSSSAPTDIRPEGGRIGLGSEVMEQDEQIIEELGYTDFNMPWRFSFRYNFNWSKPRSDEPNITQTLNFNGNLSLTPKWKIGFNSGWDFKNKELTYTSVNISRDLHCWQMRFSWIPLGSRQSYSFTISAKSAILSDLKYEKRKSWYDRDI